MACTGNIIEKPKETQAKTHIAKRFYRITYNFEKNTA